MTYPQEYRASVMLLDHLHQLFHLPGGYNPGFINEYD
nr:hypothetical protein [Escherichia coli]